MRTRAYRPEAPASLEGRSLQSGVAGQSAQPVILFNRQLNFILDHMRAGFYEFVHNHDITMPYNEIPDVDVDIPYAREDGLNAKLFQIVDRMRQELAAHVPGAVRSAMHDVTATTLADVEARVRAGDVIIR